MEEFFKTLDIKQIKILYVEYVDNDGNFKKIELGKLYNEPQMCCNKEE